MPLKNKENISKIRVDFDSIPIFKTCIMAVSTATCTAAKPEDAHILEKQISESFCLHPSKCISN